jgi:hypothetical protein
VAAFQWRIPIRYRIEPGPLDHLKTNDSDQIWGDPHLGFQRGHRKWRRRRCCAQAVNDGGAPVTSSDGDMVDEGRRDEGMSNPWSMLSIISWRDAEE